MSKELLLLLSEFQKFQSNNISFFRDLLCKAQKPN